MAWTCWYFSMKLKSMEKTSRHDFNWVITVIITRKKNLGDAVQLYSEMATSPQIRKLSSIMRKSQGNLHKQKLY
jgi:hypothetical protein